MPNPLTPAIAAQSGSAGDRTYAHNQHGLYDRLRTTPTNPNTTRQQRVRRRWANVAFRWNSVLTDAQRRLWNEYARLRVDHSFTVRRTRLTGQQAHQRANQSKQLNGFGWSDVPPTIFRDPQWTIPVNVIQAGPGIILYTIDPTDEWATTDNSAMVLQVSPPRGVAVNFFASPFRRAKILRGFAATPPAATQFMTDPWGTAVGDRRWLRTYVFLADGRVADARRTPFDDNL